jgi:hypothetical protein
VDDPDDPDLGIELGRRVHAARQSAAGVVLASEPPGLRDALAALVRFHLDNAEVHPCDAGDDAVRAAACMPEVQRAYEALVAHPSAPPAGWKITLTPEDGGYVLIAPSGAGCVVYRDEDQARVIPSQVLYELAAALSAAPSSQQPAQQPKDLGVPANAVGLSGRGLPPIPHAAGPGLSADPTTEN